MKKAVLPIISFLLVLTLLLGSFGNVKAATDDAPVVTPVSGDIVFTTTVVPIVSLPGSTAFGLMPVPVGFPAGEAQFGGDGVRVTGMDSGKATACFSIATVKINQGWSGKVAVWTGAKWAKLATTITPLDESPTSLACATILGNGTYAFIVGVGDATKLPTGKPQCSVDLLGIFAQGLEGGGRRFFDMVGNFHDNLNTLITYTIIDPSLSITGDLNATVLSDDTGYFIFSGYGWVVTQSVIYTIHIETPTCYYDWVDEYELVEEDPSIE